MPMPGDPPDPGIAAQVETLEKENARLRKIVRVLMDRAENSASPEKSAFGLFQTTVILEEQVRRRTAELEAALRENEAITRALRESEAKFRGLVEQSLVGIVIVRDGKFIYSNATFDRLFGYGAEEVRRMGPLDLVTEKDRAMVAEIIRKRLDEASAPDSYVFQGLRKDGTVIDVEAHGGIMEAGGRPAVISMLIDVTERVRTMREMQALQDMLREQSVRDALTGLYNRRYLEETLEREMAAAYRYGYPISVIMSDVDHFKSVNDRYGHAGGDEALRMCGRLIRRYARVSDICCRYGGEEFLLILPQMPEAVAVERAEQLRSAIAVAPITSGAAQFAVTASFGVASYPRAGRTVAEVIASADGALYAAKAAGRNRVNLAPPVAAQSMAV